MGAIAAVLALNSPTYANDSTAELATGGLQFVRTEDIEMRSEELSISPSEVRVTYHFVNKTDRPITNLVAFPLPDITVDNPDWNAVVPTEDPVNFLGFTTTANGQPVATQVEQKVFAMGVERTATLQQLGIPLAPQLKATSDALDALPKEKWDELIAFGVAETDEYGTTPDGKMQLHLEPRWTLKTTYYWPQTFPAGQETVIEHRYKPSVGASAGSEVGGPIYAGDPQFAADQKKRMATYTAKYCMDSGFLSAATKAQQKAKQNKGYVSEQRIDYILTTGANWAGPIADFTLTVDKGSPDNLISFCGTGVKKLTPTQFQLNYTNFTPTADLAILILTPRGPE
ncbi:MAG TPA: DUF4424 domain-containing protein [Stellaceae bacterium]|nr:DUF4424 domain-containing protein [Stellaceae bacterium]